MHEGLEIGHQMAEIAADNAGEEWKREAYEAFIEYAKNNKYFTTEDVRLANPNIKMSGDTRAWGSISRKARKNGIVLSAGLTRANSKTVHGMIVTKWMSCFLINSPELRGDK